MFYKDVEQNQFVIPSSNYHMRISAPVRLKTMFDGGEYEGHCRARRAGRSAQVPRRAPLCRPAQDARAKTSLQDAVKIGIGRLEGQMVTVGVQDFDSWWLARHGGGRGGGEGPGTAVQRQTPFIMFAASGRRAHAGRHLFADAVAAHDVAVQMLREAKKPYIVVLTNPTTGGVTASYAMLGDVHIAEPGALIGFAGPRVIEQTIREKLPEGFQRAEYLTDHGMVDMVVHRHKLRSTLAELCRLLTKAPAGGQQKPAGSGAGVIFRAILFPSP